MTPTHGYIYIWISPSGKQYVGKTTKSIEKRWKEHCYTAFNFNHHAHTFPFANAIRKYGAENFKLSMWMIVPREELNDAERHLIRTLGTQTPDGYNITEGGDGLTGIKSPKGSDHYKYLHSLTDEMVREDHSLGLSTWAAASKHNCSQVTIVNRRKALDLKSSGFAGLDSRFTLENIREMERLWKVERWSQKKIGKEFNCSSSQVSLLINGKTGPRRFTPSENW